MDELVGVTCHRDAVDWVQVAFTVADESKDWYGTLAEVTA